MNGVIGRMSGVALAGSLAIAGGLATPSTARAAVVDESYNLTLDGMSTGTCADSVCSTVLGTVTVTGDTTTSLVYTVDLAPGVSFHANHTGSSGTGDAFYLELTDTGGTGVTFSDVGTSGTIGSDTYSYTAPTTTGGPFAPNPGNFPGTYNYVVTCTNDTAGKICNSPSTGPLTFTVNANGGTLSIGSPPGPTTGDFKGDAITFVADLSIAAGTAGLCTGDSACTGLVGTGPGINLLSTGTVPEPSTWAMMLIGFAGLGYAGYRRSRKAVLIAA